MIRKNVDVSKGIANGTIAKLHGVFLKENAVVKTENMQRGRQVQMVNASDVECLIFQHQISSWKESNHFPSLPICCFPLMSDTRTIQRRFGNDRKGKRVTVRQFPCTSALVLTVHKTQGQTLDRIILGSLSKRDKFGMTGLLYVTVSRVKSIEGFYTCELLVPDEKKFKPRTSVIKVMERLQELADRTKKRLQSSPHNAIA